jgi:hypothetical protein
LSLQDLEVQFGTLTEIFGVSLLLARYKKSKEKEEGREEGRRKPEEREEPRLDKSQYCVSSGSVIWDTNGNIWSLSSAGQVQQKERKREWEGGGEEGWGIKAEEERELKEKRIKNYTTPPPLLSYSFYYIQVVVNGTADTTTANVVELAYVSGKVWYVAPPLFFSSFLILSSSLIFSLILNLFFFSKHIQGAPLWQLGGDEEVKNKKILFSFNNTPLSFFFPSRLLLFLLIFLVLFTFFLIFRQENNQNRWWYKVLPSDAWGPLNGTPDSPL